MPNPIRTVSPVARGRVTFPHISTTAGIISNGLLRRDAVPSRDERSVDGVEPHVGTPVYIIRKANHDMRG